MLSYINCTFVSFVFDTIPYFSLDFTKKSPVVGKYSISSYLTSNTASPSVVTTPYFSFSDFTTKKSFCAIAV